MTLYTDVSYAASRLITDKYSTSFGMSIRLFAPELRPHIYAIYGLVRVADEIVDTYKGPDTDELLDELEHDTYRALKSGYSANPVVQSFAATAREYGITRSLIGPFFTSMRMDLTPQTYTQKKYEKYIDGSAEVVGLMCLKVFTGDDTLYKKLEKPARHLGAAYQKVNFLRDIAADHQIGRWYFPEGSFETFNERQKKAILKDIQNDFTIATKAFPELPKSCRAAVLLSKRYYEALIGRIAVTPAGELMEKRIRIPNTQKLRLLAVVSVGAKK